jgi:hypothetical protein
MSFRFLCHVCFLYHSVYLVRSWMFSLRFPPAECLMCSGDLPVFPSLHALFTSNILSYICCPPNLVHCLQDNLEMLPSVAEIPPYAEFFPIVTNIFCGFGTYRFNFWIRILLLNWCGSRSRSYCIS